jgi:hypothetical protein
MKTEIADWISKANNEQFAVPRMFAHSAERIGLRGLWNAATVFVC